jgi:hypothetical protein
MSIGPSSPSSLPSLGPDKNSRFDASPIYIALAIIGGLGLLMGLFIWRDKQQRKQDIAADQSQGSDVQLEAFPPPSYDIAWEERQHEIGGPSGGVIASANRAEDRRGRPNKDGLIETRTEAILEDWRARETQ